MESLVVGMSLCNIELGLPVGEGIGEHTWVVQQQKAPASTNMNMPLSFLLSLSDLPLVLNEKQKQI